MTRKQKEDLIIGAILSYEIYNAKKQGEEELRLDDEELENAIDFVIGQMLDGELRNNGVVIGKRVYEEE